MNVLQIEKKAGSQKHIEKSFSPFVGWENDALALQALITLTCEQDS